MKLIFEISIRIQFFYIINWYHNSVFLEFWLLLIRVTPFLQFVTTNSLKSFIEKHNLHSGFTIFRNYFERKINLQSVSTLRIVASFFPLINYGTNCKRLIAN